MSIASVVAEYNGSAQFNWVFRNVLIYEAIMDPASIASNDSTEESLTIVGARKGDMVLVSLDTDMQGCIITGYCASNDVVDIVIHNPKGGATDLPSANLHVIVLGIYHNHPI